MKRLTTEEFKSLTIDMMDHFARFCEENGLPYVIDYGTLLGTVRHKGFIRCAGDERWDSCGGIERCGRKVHDREC